jgi:hypothetical protein
MPRRNYHDSLAADNARAAVVSRTARDIAEDYPESGDLETREACEKDLRRFCEHYFPAAFPLAWSSDHLLVLERMQEVVLGGGLFALAMPRGSGKTTISVKAAIWSLLYGHRRFVCLVGASERHAERILKQIKFDLTCNEVLAADFRQVCHPLIKLENNARKAAGQLFDGQQTQIEWAADRLTFPRMPDWACDGVNVGGSTVTVAGITGALRGQSAALPDSSIVRPELVILDDPQTRESARSRSQSEDRMAIVSGDVLGMAGPGKKIAAIMPCTVIKADDMADQLLDRKKNPEWSGRKTRMVRSFPTNTALWERYHEIRSESLEAGRDGSEATDFYRANREEMDAGSEVSWPERYDPDEISAIQHAMNLKFRDPAAFFAEYQNEPLPDTEIRADILTADEITARINRIACGTVPLECTRLTAFIDVHQDVLYYSVVGWDDHFGGAVIDYGTYPDQKRGYFTLRDATQTLSRVTRAAGVEGQIYAGLEKLTDLILDREWIRADGLSFRVERCPIDANWGAQTDVVYQFCRESKHAAILTPSHGKGIGASGRPMSEWKARPGERLGLNWYMPLDSRGKRSIRKVIFDANYWKSFVHARLAVSRGDRGSLVLFGDRPQAHRLYADHLTAEYPVAVRRDGSSRVVDEWKPVVGKPDNHYLDTLVGSAVAASMCGVSLAESQPSKPKPRKRMSFRDLQSQRGA